MIRLSSFMGAAVKKFNKAIEERVSVTSEVISSMREVRMLGMIAMWLDAIQALRIEELNKSMSYRRYIVYINLLGTVPVLSPIR
jgi:ATP-binding cassette, subfamily C (CFTR/MRP), member 1